MPRPARASEPADMPAAAAAVATWHRRRREVCDLVCGLPLTRGQRAELYERIGAHVSATVAADRAVRLDLDVDPWPQA